MTEILYDLYKKTRVSGIFKNIIVENINTLRELQHHEGRPY